MHQSAIRNKSMNQPVFDERQYSTAYTSQSYRAPLNPLPENTNTDIKAYCPLPEKNEPTQSAQNSLEAQQLLSEYKQLNGRLYYLKNRLAQLGVDV